MGLVTFPALALPWISPPDLVPVVPGQVAQVSPFTGAMQVLSRGAGTWSGSLQINPMDDAEEARAKAVEGWLAIMSDIRHTCEVPLDRDTFTGANTTIAAITSSGDRLRYRLASSGTGLGAGDFVRVGNRLLVVAERISNRDFYLWPELVDVKAATVSPATSILVRSQPGNRTLPRTADFWGPWSFPFLEAI